MAPVGGSSIPLSCLSIINLPDLSPFVHRSENKLILQVAYLGPRTISLRGLLEKMGSFGEVLRDNVSFPKHPSQDELGLPKPVFSGQAIPLCRLRVILGNTSAAFV